MKYSEEFKEFYRNNFPRTEMDSSNTIIAFDTNSLLNVFRFTPEAAKTFFKAIECSKDYLYIPYLVALEFHFHKKETFEINNKKVQSAKDAIEKRWKELGDEFSSDIFKDFSFRNGNDASKEMEKKISSLIWDTINQEEGKIKDEALSLIHKVKENQEVLHNDLISVIESKTGDKYLQEFIDQVQKEGKERYANNIPPGYDDHSKKGYRKYNKIQYELKYGDLIIWKDLIEVAKNKDNIQHVILVTSDGKAKTKNDLLYKVGGEIIGPRIELLHEMREQGGAEFYIIDELEFIEQFSQEQQVSSQVVKSISDTLATLSKNLSPIPTNEIAKSFVKATSSLGNNFSSVSRRRKVTDVFDLENILIEDYEISDRLSEYLTNELHNIEFETEYGDMGWGEFEDLSILQADIEEYEFEDNFSEIKCTASVTAQVGFDVVTPNPDYESDEEEFFYESNTMEAEFVISFCYDLDYDIFENIEIDEFEF